MSKELSLQQHFFQAIIHKLQFVPLLLPESQVVWQQLCKPSNKSVRGTWICRIVFAILIKEVNYVLRYQAISLQICKYLCLFFCPDPPPQVPGYLSTFSVCAATSHAIIDKPVYEKVGCLGPMSFVINEDHFEQCNHRQACL